MRSAVLVLAIFAVAVCRAQPEEPAAIVTPSPISALTPTQERPPVQSAVPKEILEPVLNKAAALANVSRDQLVIVRAEPATWNDGSLGCPEPGMQYTQALVEGYWVVIKAGGQTYDFRMGRGGSFQLCPPGRGHPPSQQDAS